MSQKQNSSGFDPRALFGNPGRLVICGWMAASILTGATVLGNTVTFANRDFRREVCFALICPLLATVIINVIWFRSPWPVRCLLVGMVGLNVFILVNKV